MPILEVENLSISFNQYTAGLKQKNIQVISSLHVTLEEGEILAVVGASGSGKSLLAHAILGILPNNATISGTIKYDGEVLTAARQASLRGKEIALIPQSVNYLDPLMRVGNQVRTSVKGGDADCSTTRRFLNDFTCNRLLRTCIHFSFLGVWREERFYPLQL